ncbi:unnamed protein product [Blepharisma stoltei]|uniref:Uncharacterized protein n=1 Tax=Blepharisma stoltei TaxID=1481888 RepID=A0AAU9JCT4_9CILI|nr:unnamed protein product [Blepharisma stoltei]
MDITWIETNPPPTQDHKMNCQPFQHMSKRQIRKHWITWTKNKPWANYSCQCTNTITMSQQCTFRHTCSPTCVANCKNWIWLRRVFVTMCAFNCKLWKAINFNIKLFSFLSQLSINWLELNDNFYTAEMLIFFMFQQFFS